MTLLSGGFYIFLIRFQTKVAVFTALDLHSTAFHKICNSRTMYVVQNDLQDVLLSTSYVYRTLNLM
jgi:hypothetical protein